MVRTKRLTRRLVNKYFCCEKNDVVIYNCVIGEKRTGVGGGQTGGGGEEEGWRKQAVRRMGGTWKKWEQVRNNIAISSVFTIRYV